MTKHKKDRKFYLGVDLGGTKILAALARASGKIVGRKRCPTPRSATHEEIFATIVGLIEDLLGESGLRRRAIRGLGIAVPGIVDAADGRVVVTPNMNLSGFKIVPRLKKIFRVPIALGNDVNLGTLGEQWLGAAALADSAVGIFVGTGIGGGIIVNGKLLTGHHGAAGEVGHMHMQKDGPLCGCGAHGCLEALASRTAIERDIRQAVAAGRKTVLSDVVGSDLSVIRSNVLKRALQEDDELVKEVMTRAADTLGAACLQIRHLLDPEVIILGGGVIEACKSFVVPIVQRTLTSDPFSGARSGGRVVVSALGDDAVVLGAVALAQQHEGRDPLKKARRRVQQYPSITGVGPETITVDGTTYKEDIFVRADGKVRKRRKTLADSATPGQIDRDELKAVCKRKPAILIIGSGDKQPLTIAAQGEDFLRRRGIIYESLPTAEAAAAYNSIKGRKAALLHLG